MATEPKAATEEPKIDLFEDDDEFEEFEINQGKIPPFFFLFDLSRWPCLFRQWLALFRSLFCLGFVC